MQRARKSEKERERERERGPAVGAYGISTVTISCWKKKEKKTNSTGKISGFVSFLAMPHTYKERDTHIHKRTHTHTDRQREREQTHTHSHTERETCVVTT